MAEVIISRGSLKYLRAHITPCCAISVIPALTMGRSVMYTNDYAEQDHHFREHLNTVSKI